ncbi:hypothetical protein BJF93_03515 [Xaviernesmea oryzae]|uniref:Uncharacterized protein n=2 Tax=Xaviernesmea oryzae TaxID=464029 RepID=A0A1Q9AZJ5_9HYPH|nr:hypothetical protein BJF93_03515 [Xaviernesmea oryzae]
MRARVYEKARGAVRRQLEGMKPRPSDDMINRQMTKLEAAIADVESDFAEAVAEEAPIEDIAGEAAAPDQPVYDESHEPAAQDERADAAHAESQAEPADAERSEGPAPLSPHEPPPEHWQTPVVLQEEPAPAATLPDPAVHQAALEADDRSRAEDEARYADHAEPEARQPVEHYEPAEAYEPVVNDQVHSHEADVHENRTFEPAPHPDRADEPAYAPAEHAPAPSAAYDDDHDAAPAHDHAHHPADAYDLPDDHRTDGYVPDEFAGRPAETAAEDRFGIAPVEPAPYEPEHAEFAPAEPAPVEPAHDAWTDAAPEAYDDRLLDDPYAQHAEVQAAPQAHAEPWPAPEAYHAGDAAADDAARALAEEYDDLSDQASGPFETHAQAVVEPHVPAEPAYEVPAPAPSQQAAAASAEDDAAAALVEAYGDGAGRAQQIPSADWELPEWNTASAPAPAQPVHAHIEPEWHQTAEHVAYPDEPEAVVVPAAAAVAPAAGAPAVMADPQREAGQAEGWTWDDHDPFAATPDAGSSPKNDVRKEGEADSATGWAWPVEAQPATVQDERLEQDWEAIDALLSRSVNKDEPAAETEAPVVAPRPISYRTEPKPPRFSIKKALGLIVLLGVLGGGGYAYWLHRSTVDAWVGDLLASASVPAPSQAPGNAGQSSGSASPAATTETAAVANKFTQRLRADGSEIDEGVAPAAGRSTADEGRSVSAQTEAGNPVETAQADPAPTPTANPAPAEGAAAPATTPPPAGSVSATDAGTPAAAASVEVPAGAQKMFLYEERLGQAAPTAIEGSVAWTLKEETPDGASRPEPVIQAQITVPGRGLTALMTIKRNTDSSLPASHVIEFVFSLPANFEGGTIAGVQRVSMKRTEQDRGDALIGVPAKITDDFHMIALNDFPEAVKTNLDLLGSRGWMDIPLTYRNGRRALLTLDKGTAGADAFSQALRTWAAIKPSAG